MHWLIGIDEAGYGPNLGPFVMSAVACRVPDHHRDADLWELLGDVARRRCDRCCGKFLVDDSKKVYAAGAGIRALETGVLATMPSLALRDSFLLHALIQRVAPASINELGREHWYNGTTLLPLEAESEELSARQEDFAVVSAKNDVEWQVARSVIVCPMRFNTITEQRMSKGAVLAQCLAELLQHCYASCEPAATMNFVVDKHGGRKSYGGLIQNAFPDEMVVARQESADRSNYCVLGSRPEIQVTVLPRADAAHFCVALASMVSKYLREALMRELNSFWRKHVPDLKPTAGYPVDAARFLSEIRPAISKLQMDETSIWRVR